MTHFIPFPAMARLILPVGLLFVVLGLATPIPAVPDEPGLLAGPVVPGASSTVKSGCAAMGGKQLKSTNANASNVDFHIGLGSLTDGQAGQLTLHEVKIIADIYTPEMLRFSMPSGRNGVEMIPDDSKPARMVTDYKAVPLRQVRVPGALMDIVVISQWEYELRFYLPQYIGAKRGRLYQLTGEPYLIYRFRNPNPPSQNRLEITTMKDGGADTSGYFYDARLELWSLTKNGQEISRKTSAINPDDPCERIETRLDAEGSGFRKTVKVYKGFPWGQDLVKKIEDPDGEARTTIYKYFEDPNARHYSWLKTTIHPNGDVESHN